MKLVILSESYINNEIKNAIDKVTNLTSFGEPKDSPKFLMLKALKRAGLAKDYKLIQSGNAAQHSIHQIVVYPSDWKELCVILNRWNRFKNPDGMDKVLSLYQQDDLSKWLATGEVWCKEKLEKQLLEF